MKEKLLNIKNQALGEIINASSPERLEEIRISLLGKNGSLNEITKLLSTVNKEERAEL
jgi:phenylalanyl-tRNA synthetase alpha chain